MSFYKILVIGEAGVGKTSMTNKIVYNTFLENYKATIGCEFGLKVMNVNGEVVRVQLWDLAGQDRLGGISKLYCRDANGALVVADVTKPETFEQAQTWKRQVDEIVQLADNTPIPMVLCMNKHDLVPANSAVNETRLDECVATGKFVSGFFTSAKNGANTEKALERLILEVIQKCSSAGEESAEAHVKKRTQRLGRKEPHKGTGCCS